MTEKIAFCSAFGFIGTIIVYLFGGWSIMLETLLLFMLTDYITGIICAAIFKASTKSESGSLSSKAGLRGIVKKFGILIMVAVTYRMDVLLNLNNVLLTAIELTLVANEAISILENLKAMGVPIPKKLAEAVETISKKGE